MMVHCEFLGMNRKMMEFVSWEYEIPALEGHNPVMFQTTNLL
jgi:hypothetical protein